MEKALADALEMAEKKVKKGKEKKKGKKIKSGINQRFMLKNYLSKLNK